MELINAQADGCTDEQLAELQKKLNSTYDNFRTKFGNITDSANSRCFSNDDDYNTLAALEVVNVENKTVERLQYSQRERYFQIFQFQKLIQH